MTGEEIAIIGMAIRAPCADNIDAYWANLVAGRDCISRGDIPAIAQGEEAFVPAIGKLDQISGFDAEFFGYGAAEATMLDPQHRLFLECCSEALQSAGYERSSGRPPTGVFGACGFPTYLIDHISPVKDLSSDAGRLETLLTNDKDFLAARAAHKLDLGGPALVVQAACSSSLVAIHQAAQAILLGECDMALAGGVAIDTRRTAGYHYEPGLILSIEGRVRSFDREGSGTVPGAGCGVVLLKRLEDAIRERDTIYAKIIGSAVVNDGARRAGFTAPTVEGVKRAAELALAVSGVAADSINFIEGHGSGTPLGDRTELAALSSVYGERHGACYIGSVKSNIGHLDVAAGVAGFIKAALSLHHRHFPPSINFREPPPEIGSGSSPLRVADRPIRLDTDGGRPIRGAVNSMGLGGHSVHVVLEAADPAESSSAGDAFDLVAWSARTSVAADELGTRLGLAIRERSHDMRDVCFSMAHCRNGYRNRRLATVRKAGDSLELDVIAEAILHEPKRRTIFQFHGFGESDGHRAADLGSCPALRDSIGELVETAGGIFGATLQTQVVRRLEEPSGSATFAQGRPAKESDSSAADHIAHFIVQYSLFRQLRAWGLPDGEYCGYSLGEFTAATLAGVFVPEDAIRLVGERAQIVDRTCPRGMMLAAPENFEQLCERFGPEVHLAIEGGPLFTAFAGPQVDLEALRGALLEEGIVSQRLAGTHAFHTPHLTPAIDEFRDLLRSIPMQTPASPYHSGLLGKEDIGAEVATPDYWLRHLTEPLRYGMLLRQLLSSAPTALVEIGHPGHLTSLARQALGAMGKAGENWAGGCILEGEATRAGLQEGLGRLWLQGVPVDWSAMCGELRAPRRIALPTYPFQRLDYWIESRTGLDRRSETSTYSVTWEPVAQPRQFDLGGGEPVVAQVEAIDAGEAAGCLDGDRARLVIDGRIMRLDDSGEVTGWLETVSSSPDFTLWLDLREGAAAESLSTGLAVARLISLIGQALPKLARPPSGLVVSAPHTFSIDRGDRSSPVGHTLASCLQVLAQEGLISRAVFVDRGEESGFDASALKDTVARSPTGTFAWRKGKLLIRALRPLPLQPAHPPLLREGATYLITGGSGQIAGALARYLRDRYGARIVLLSRNANDKLEPGIVAIQADISNQEAVRLAFANCGIAIQDVKGVFHLAALTGEVIPVDEMTTAQIAEHLYAKGGGATVVSDVFGAHAEFLVAFSSTATYLGGQGLYAYAAANAWLEGYTLDAFQRGIPWSVLAWDVWELGAHSTTRTKLRNTSFDAGRALSLLDSLLVRGAGGHVVLLNGGHEERLRAASVRARSRAVRSAAAAAQQDQAPDAETAVSSATVHAKDIARMWSEILGMDVTESDDFFEIGGDSLLAARIAGAIRRQWNIRLPLPEFIANSSPRLMADLVNLRMGTVAQVEGNPDPSDDLISAHRGVSSASPLPN